MSYLGGGEEGILYIYEKITFFFERPYVISACTRFERGVSRLPEMPGTHDTIGRKVFPSASALDGYHRVVGVVSCVTDKIYPS